MLSRTYKFQTEAIAIGNGTASRETEMLVKALKLPSSIPVVMVNKSGAPIYSASDVAREQFPNHDFTVRGAASIGRRLMDPLAELVKLDPKSIGVGQYQHDVDPFALKRSLDGVDLRRKRIALSMKAAPPIGAATTGKTTSPPGRLWPPTQPVKSQAADWFTEALNRNRPPKGP